MGRSGGGALPDEVEDCDVGLEVEGVPDLSLYAGMVRAHGGCNILLVVDFVISVAYCYYTMKLKCLRCGYEWVRRVVATDPKRCAACHNPKWNVPYGYVEPKPDVRGGWIKGEWALYFAETDDHTYIKVGISCDANKRRRYLKYEAQKRLFYPETPEVHMLVIAKVDNPAGDEQAILGRFRRIAGEWLLSTPELRAFIEGFGKEIV